VFGYDPYGHTPYGRTPYGGIGIDVTDGDIVENIPGTPFGIDLETGGLELNLGGIDIPI